jgi:pyruvate kinase
MIATAIAWEACCIAPSLGGKLIVCFTRSGRTARLVAQVRPTLPVVVLSNSETVLRHCTLVRGVHPIQIKDDWNSDSMVKQAKSAATEPGFAHAEDRVVIFAGNSHGSAAETDRIQVEVL